MRRRDFLVGLAATGAAAAASAGKSPADRGIVDVHAHFMPPELKAAGAIGVMGDWTLGRHLDAMNEAGVARSILSITTPGVLLSGPAGWKLTRTCNEYAASLASQERRKLGFFIYTRVDDIDKALAEIAYGFDSLNACGVGLFTSYESQWLGDPRFDPLFEELNRRSAIVQVHPTSGPCCRGLIPNVADTVIEFETDTTRAIASYVYRGAAARYPRVKMIWSHSGGTMPSLIERFDFADKSPEAHTSSPNGFRATAAKFYYDVAQASNPAATSALRRVVPVDHIVFGTDFPFRTPLEHVRQLEAGGIFSDRELRGIYRGNVQAGLTALLNQG